MGFLELINLFNGRGSLYIDRRQSSTRYALQLRRSSDLQMLLEDSR